MTETGTLEDAALKRKERLQALKRKRQGGNDEAQPNEATLLPKPVFRSYRPEHVALKDNIMPDAKPGNLEEDIKEQLEAAKSKVVLDELDITNLAPRKPDWDLKRDVAKKLEKLERRTQRAIPELIIERLKQRQEDVSTMMVNAPGD